MKTKSAIFVLAGALLTGCGGGSSSSSAPETSANLPSSPASSFSVGGTVSGVIGPGLVLQLNGNDDMAVDLNRDFTFPVKLSQGSAYQVTVKSNSAGQSCRIAANGTGKVEGVVSNVQVNCTTPVPVGGNAFRIGGTISGLTGTGLILNNGMYDNLVIAPNGTQFSFVRTLPSGADFSVSIAAQPTSQTCMVRDGSSGQVISTDITTVVVTCTTPATSDGLSVDQTTLTFTGEEDQSVAAQTVSGAINGATGPVIVKISLTNHGLLSAVFDFTSASGRWQVPPSNITNTSISFPNLTVTSAISGQLQVTPRKPGDLAPGTYRDTVTIEACYDSACTRPLPGSPRLVKVSYTVQAPRPAPMLWLSDRGVALASTPGGSRLSRTLTVRYTSDAPSNWTASSDASWLAVTAAGTSGGQLALTANAAGLSPGLRTATVTVASSNSRLAAQTVRVGLYIDTTTPAVSLTDPMRDPTGIRSQLAETAQAADPVRPLVYSTSGASIAVHHVYSGARTATIAVPNADLDGLVVNDDGSRLYALNYANNQIVVVNLDTMSVLNAYGFPQLVEAPLRMNRMAFARVGGQAVLMLTNVRRFRPYSIGNVEAAAPVFKADTGEMLGQLPLLAQQTLRLSASRDGTTVYGAEAERAGILSATRVEMRTNSVGNVNGKAVASTTGVNVQDLQDMASSPDGSRVYLLYSKERAVREAVYAGNTLQWTAGFAPSIQPPPFMLEGMMLPNLEVDTTGRLFINDAWFDLRIFTASGALERQWLSIADQTLTNGVAASMRVSGDGMRLIGNGRLMGIAQ